MKQNVAKRAIAATLGCAFLIAVVGCSSNSNNSSSVVQPTQTPNTNQENTDDSMGYETLQLGMGIVVSSATDSADVNVPSTSGKVSHTAVTVLLEDDVICGSLLDEHESHVSTQETGLMFPDEIQSKREQGETYGMRSYSGIGKEWYEQADAFCHYIQGMTCEEVMNIPVDDYGKTTEEDLAAGCTISIVNFQKAVEKACDNAKKVSDMDVEDYTNENGGLLGDLVDGAEDVLDGVEDGVTDMVNGAENGADTMMNGAENNMDQNY